MNDSKKIQLKEEIDEIKKLNIEQFFYVLKYVIEAYIRSLITFGPNSKVTKEVKRIWNEFIKILKEEKEIHKYILKNSLSINFSEAVELVDELDEVNDDTIEYLYNSLDDILDACDTRFEDRMAHYPKTFSTLVETDEYRTSAAGLTLTFEDVKEFLNYPQEFWDYVNPRIRRVDPRIEGNELLYVTFIKTKGNGILEDFRVYIPEIINLKTACVNVHELKHAYDLYQRIGQEIDEKESHYEEDACNLEKEFQKEYVLSRFTKK